MQDIIVAVATSMIKSSLSIIRVSGKGSLDIFNKIFISKNNRKIKSFSMTYGKIINNFNGKELDEVLATPMLAPNTYTKEDMFEISCHGNFLIIKSIFDLIIKNGARVSKEGEFTKRAFSNGRIDLTQAEAVLDLINSNSNEAVSKSIENLKGELRDIIYILKNRIINVLSSINVVVDYPEEVEDILSLDTIKEIDLIKFEVNEIILSYEKGKKIKEGIKVAIVGKPNVGKSSMLNKFLREDRAIVTEVAGTTRDTIEESILIKGNLINLIDTAGIRDTEDKVEKIGINFSRKAINKADFIILILDSSLPIENEDLKIIELIKNKKFISIINKRDLEKKINLENLNLKNILEFSTNKDKIEVIENFIYDQCIKNEIDSSNSRLILSNLRHKNLLEKTKSSLENFINNSVSLPLDICSIDLMDSINHLAEITGEITNEDILDNIFSNFCVGK